MFCKKTFIHIRMRFFYYMSFWVERHERKEKIKKFSLQSLSQQQSWWGITWLPSLVNTKTFSSKFPCCSYSSFVSIYPNQRKSTESFEEILINSTPDAYPKRKKTQRKMCEKVDKYMRIQYTNIFLPRLVQPWQSLSNCDNLLINFFYKSVFH